MEPTLTLLTSEKDDTVAAIATHADAPADAADKKRGRRVRRNWNPSQNVQENNAPEGGGAKGSQKKSQSLAEAAGVHFDSFKSQKAKRISMVDNSSNLYGPEDSLWSSTNEEPSANRSSDNNNPHVSVAAMAHVRFLTPEDEPNAEDGEAEHGVYVDDAGNIFGGRKPQFGKIGRRPRMQFNQSISQYIMDDTDDVALHDEHLRSKSFVASVRRENASADPSVVSTAEHTTGRQDLIRLLSQAADAAQAYRERHGALQPSEVTETEAQALDRLLEEMQYLRESFKRRYDQNTVSGSWARLVESPNFAAFGQALYDKFRPRIAYLPEQLAVMTVAERIRLIMRVLGEAVEMYQTPSEMLVRLQEIGAMHRLYGVGVAGFMALRDAFKEALPKFVDAEVMTASAEDWDRFWFIAVDSMSYGNQSELGEKYGARFRDANNVRILQYLHRIRDLDRQNSSGRAFVLSWFAKAAQKSPELQVFYDAVNTSRSPERFFNALLQIAELLPVTEEADAYIFELGGRHDSYNVTDSVMIQYQEPFLETCQETFADEWDPIMEQIFLNFFTYASGKMINGMESGKNTGENRRAPDGSEPFCLLFTDIESSTNLWQRDPDVMRAAVERHHRLIRAIIADYDGYEVKTAGDSFIIAAQDVLVGMKIAIAIQLELMREVPIAPGFKMLDEVQGHGDPSAWSDETLRVRIGIEHCTEATATYDTIHRRYDYYGTSVNRCARIEAAAAGGQILMSSETFQALKKIPSFHDEPCPAALRGLSMTAEEDGRGLDHFVAMRDVGSKRLKGLLEPVHLASAVPLCFSGRNFP